MITSLKATARKPMRSLLAATTGLAMLVAMPVFAGPGKDHHCGKHHPASISVTGTGEASVAPDMATISLGVTTRADNASDAMAQNSTQQTAVLDALKNAGIEARDIQTSGLSLNPVMDYSREGEAPQVTGYRAENMLTLRVRDIDALGGVLDAIVGAGANEIRGISFEREDNRAVQDEARQNAVADARHRAEVIAEAAGLDLGPVLTIRHGMTGGPRPEPMRMRAMASAPGGGEVPVAAGELSLNAQVDMQFALLGEGGENCAGHHGDEDADPAEGQEAAPAN